MSRATTAPHQNKMLDSCYDCRLRRTMELTAGLSTDKTTTSALISPIKNRTNSTLNIGDRLVPTRAGNNLQVAFLMKEKLSPTSSSMRNREGPPVVV
ncbi:hypothetical protein DAPPUDRAFT_265695 [Daphnia pulex]|uniref:Uncharacterized protein n=1 Tax=Daphnia pulex TaxID=6669 RepID=E9HTV6_DAPPU|nr:hypothetical protein DAPPUDRAFT_265695 [Daphnia pulex]|eukprot:EFX64823.1 hypothetical protein DAPPUDRAFT_265695 [Daphnia pulex]